FIPISCVPFRSERKSLAYNTSRHASPWRCGSTTGSDATTCHHDAPGMRRGGHGRITVRPGRLGRCRPRCGCTRVRRFRPHQSDISRALRPRAWSAGLCFLSRTTLELEALLMWPSFVFSRVGADSSSASRKRQGTRPNSRRQRFRPQIEALEDRLTPALLIVRSLTDAPVNLTDATVTLRDAIYAANNDLQVSPGGPTGSGADEIQFHSGLTGTIPLSQGELAITSNLKISGPGAGSLTISGSGLSRIFNVDDGVLGPTIDVQIVGLTLTGGKTLGSGGAIASFENLTVTNAVI